VKQPVSLSEAKARHGKPVAVLLSEQAIAQWRSAGQTSHPEDWPVASGVPGEEAVKSWRDRSVGREVWLA